MGFFILSTAAYANDAGCGLGSLVIQRNTKLSQSLAITTNMTLLNAFFGITSGTSNCSANGFVFREKEAVTFAEANIQSLKVEMAKGQGENLSAFAQLLGCHQEAISAFGQMTQSKYETLFPSEKVVPVQVLDSVKKEINNNPTLKIGCSTTT
jgi:Protein of unknown function (DUF3015)